MKSASVATVLAPVVAAHGQWFGGAPDCATSCLSSHYAGASSTASNWPAPTSYCDSSRSNSIDSCLMSACSATPTAYSSYSSMSASLCSRHSECQSKGSTGVYTLTAPSVMVTHGPGGGLGHGMSGMSGMSFSGPSLTRRNAGVIGGPQGGDSSFGPGFGGGDGMPGGHSGSAWPGWNKDVSKTWTGGVFTVTGCTWDGPNPWGGGPGGWDGPASAWGGWGDWGHGWTWSTHTTDAAITATNSVGSTFTTSGTMTLAQAVSGNVTSTHFLQQAAASGNASSSTSSSSAASGISNSNLGLKIAGVALGTLIGAVALI